MLGSKPRVRVFTKSQNNTHHNYDMYQKWLENMPIGKCVTTCTFNNDYMEQSNQRNYFYNLRP